MTETWRPIAGFEYDVSDCGRVRNARNGAILKPWRRGRYGHLSVRLRRNGQNKDKYVHVLVMAAFVGSPTAGLETRHRNGNAQDNRLTNLTYGTRSENAHDRVVHGTHHKSRQTTCKRGHPLPPSVPGTRRACAACQKIRNDNRPKP